MVGLAILLGTVSRRDLAQGSHHMEMRWGEQGATRLTKSTCHSWLSWERDHHHLPLGVLGQDRVALLEGTSLTDQELLLLSWEEMDLPLHLQVDHLGEVVEDGELITGMLLELSLSCPSLFSLHGEDLPRMAAMEALAGVMVVTHLLHQVVLQHALPHLATCLHGELHHLLDQEITLQASQWVDLLLPHHQEEKAPLDQAAVEHHLVDGACLHGVQHPHLLLGELQLLAPFHHLLVVEVLLLPCHTGTRVEVEDGVVDKLTHSQTFLVLHHRHPLLAKHEVHQKRLGGDFIEV